MHDYDAAIAKALNVKYDDIQYPPESPDWNRMSTNEDDPAFREEFQAVISNDAIPHVDVINNVHEDEYINMRLGLPRGPDETIEHATVKRRAVDSNGLPIGIPSNNPMTDTRL